MCSDCCKLRSLGPREDAAEVWIYQAFDVVGCCAYLSWAISHGDYVQSVCVRELGVSGVVCGGVSHKLGIV